MATLKRMAMAAVILAAATTTTTTTTTTATAATTARERDRSGAARRPPMVKGGGGGASAAAERELKNPGLVPIRGSRKWNADRNGDGDGDGERDGVGGGGDGTRKEGLANGGGRGATGGKRLFYGGNRLKNVVGSRWRHNGKSSKGKSSKKYRGWYYDDECYDIDIYDPQIDEYDPDGGTVPTDNPNFVHNRIPNFVTVSVIHDNAHSTQLLSYEKLFLPTMCLFPN
ncbi:hypothetical protein ACHAW5_004661 [Stephanodiscus triporus]|uniref:Uncharacterized protein n=1 Tax=Stephanodiscus triporus TaxID=2934178 RepID=A0ABD3MGV3_9STRA